MDRERKHVICRACHAHCGLIVDFENGAPVAAHGDKDNPAFHGYSCVKGRGMMNYHSLSTRLLHSQKRRPDGGHDPIAWRDAANEIAAKVDDIVAKHGPDAVALYVGTFGYTNLATHAFGMAFLEAIGSRMYFTSVTIDQPGKGVARAAHGAWLAGPYKVSEWDGLMLVGTNPVISQNGGLGTNPARNLHEGKKRGMELIVVDPRRSDCAAKADLYLQPRPGEDVAILGAIIRQLIADDALDHDFIKENVDGFENLKAAVEPFDPRRAGERADVAPDDIVKAARMIGGWKRGHVSVGTGPNMSGFGNAVEFMSLAIQSLRGHWRRAGEIRQNEGFFINPSPAIAAAAGPLPATGFGKKLRVRGLEESISGLPTAALADEILTPGDGQVKALFVLGGNPMLAWPDQIKTFEAMKALDLLVCFDPKMSKTGALSDYVIAPKVHFEILGTTAAPELFGNFGAGWGFEETYAQVSEPIVETPEGSDLVEEYAFFHAMAKAMDKPLSVKSWSLMLDPAAAEANRTVIAPEADTPSPVEAWDAALNKAPVSVAEALRIPEAHKGYAPEERSGAEIAPKPDDWAEKLAVGESLIIEEIDRYAERLGDDAAARGPASFPYRMISRRLNNVLNSSWHEEPMQRGRTPHHPAYVNPEDLDALGLADGERIEIESARGAIQCVAYAAPDVRPGCLSVPHAWGTNPDENEDPLGAGGNTGRLSANDVDYDPVTGIPIMSAIPVRVRAAPAL